MRTDPEWTPYTAAIVNFDGATLLDATIRSLQKLSPPPWEILLVDDGSRDDSIAHVRKHWPRVRILALPKHTGIANRARNRALEQAHTRFVLVTDNDVIFASDALRKMMAVLTRRPDAAACTGRVLYADDPGTIYSEGGRLHYLCASEPGDRDREDAQAPDAPYRAIGGGISLIDRARATSTGFFDPDFVLGWGDDGEFHHRLELAGFACYAVPSAKIYHRRIRREARYYGQIRNRWSMILQCYAGRTIALTAPALLLYELLLFAFLCLKGEAGAYFRAMAYVAGNLRHLEARRRTIQALRRAPDRELLVGHQIYVPVYLGTNGRILAMALRGVNFVFRGYWQLIRGLL